MHLNLVLLRRFASKMSNVGKFYFQADISHIDRSTYPLSSDFKPTIIQPKGDKINAYYRNKTAKFKACISRLARKTTYQP